jgi:hypothetical protein
MKKHFYQNMLPLLAASFLLLPISGCDKNNTKLYLTYEPVYTSRAEVLASINGNAAQKVDSPGKVYVKGSYIFINDLNKGIHIIDNRNPVHPTQVAYLAIPGNQDIAVKDNTLYADMYDALLAIDISDPRHARITKQLAQVFPMRAFVNGRATSAEGKVITGWTKKYVKDPPDIYPCVNCLDDMPANAFSSANGSKGLAGSMAKMILINDRLFALTESHTLSIIQLDDRDQPIMGNQMMAGFDLETIYPFQDKLFLGSSSAVYIYNISNPDAPVAQGTFSHGKACDPVITDGEYAYVTLHTGGMCGGANNELDVVDVKNLSNPVLVKTYPMTKPMGLTKDGDLLFVCDKEGVKVFDAHDPQSLILRATLKAEDAYEAMAYNHRLLVTGSRGIYQYDYTRQGIPLLSVLPVGH